MNAFSPLRSSASLAFWTRSSCTREKYSQDYFDVRRSSTSRQDTTIHMSDNKKLASTVISTDKSGAFIRKDSGWRNFVSKGKSLPNNAMLIIFGGKNSNFSEFISLHIFIDGKFPPEKDRYHLFIAYACPWAHRTLMMRALKGLEDTISVTVVHPIFKKTKPENSDDKHYGWVFGSEEGESFQNEYGLGGPFPSAYPGNGACFNLLIYYEESLVGI